MKYGIPTALLFSCLTVFNARGEITIESVDNSDGQSTIALNVNIDAAGGASTPSPWFSVSGSVYTPGSFNGIIGITMDAMKNVSVDAATRGDELTDGTFDRDDNGYIGVQGAPNSGGIGAEASSRRNHTLIRWADQH